MTTTTATGPNTPATSASLLKNVTRYEDVKNTATTSKNGSEMGKQDFLKLFTAQLQNQNPLDPVKNEAFVAQLAQFSQLEALTNMQSSLDNFVTSMSAERMLGGASLIGKKVSVANAPALLGASGGIDATIDLPNGASGVQLSITDRLGRTVQDLIAGAQTPGTASLSWDGLDAMGNRAPEGTYRLTAKAVVNGKTTDVAVNTMSTVRGITTNPSDGAVSLELDGQQTVLLKNVQRIGM
jgi:flagellar basal-body rod modification protein FlgD